MYRKANCIIFLFWVNYKIMNSSIKDVSNPFFISLAIWWSLYMSKIFSSGCKTTKLQNCSDLALWVHPELPSQAGTRWLSHILGQPEKLIKNVPKKGQIINESCVSVFFFFFFISIATSFFFNIDAYICVTCR